MKEKYIALLALISAIVILILSDFGRNRTVVYDCSIAEWHPDIPKTVKEECRKLRKELLYENERTRA